MQIRTQQQCWLLDNYIETEIIRAIQWSSHRVGEGKKAATTTSVKSQNWYAWKRNINKHQIFLFLLFVVVAGCACVMCIVNNGEAATCEFNIKVVWGLVIRIPVCLLCHSNVWRLCAMCVWACDRMNAAYGMTWNIQYCVVCTLIDITNRNNHMYISFARKILNCVQFIIHASWIWMELTYLNIIHSS